MTMNGKSLAMYVWANYFGKSTTMAKDVFGVKIAKGNYGDHDSAYGWDIDHLMRPRSIRNSSSPSGENCAGERGDSN